MEYFLQSHDIFILFLKYGLRKCDILNCYTVRPRNREERKNRNPPPEVLKRWQREAQRQREREQATLKRQVGKRPVQQQNRQQGTWQS